MGQVDFIPPHRKDLYFRVIDDLPNIHLVAYRLHFLESYFPQEKIDLALKWLITNNLTGKKFVKWFAEECRNSHLQMHSTLLQAVDNAPLQPIVVGKNFRL